MTRRTVNKNDFPRTWQGLQDYVQAIGMGDRVTFMRVSDPIEEMATEPEDAHTSASPDLPSA